MNKDVQIIGFRGDRIGARLICLLNVMRLAQRYGASGRFLWLSEPGGDYPELSDPHDFFAPEFVAAHIRIVTGLPDLSGPTNIGAVAQTMARCGFGQRLAEGQRYVCDTMSDSICFMDETIEAANAEVREVAATIALSAPLEKALARARRKIARIGDGEPVAVHLRRGDLMDSDPWSYSGWPAKFVADEFARAFVAMTEGPVIAFSDTPQAIAHMAQGDPRILSAAELFGDEDQPQAMRDLLELLLMSGCAQVGAPSASAFSRAAAVAGSCRIVSLPGALPDKLRIPAYGALLDRVIGRQDSFLAPGDLAQSAIYAAKHAVVSGRGTEFVAAFDGKDDFLERFPFVCKEMAVTAWASGRVEKARNLARQALAMPKIRHRDKPQCRQVLLLSEAGNKPERDPLLNGQFLTMLFTGRAAEGPVIPVLARHLVRQGAQAVQALLFSQKLLASCVRDAPESGQGAKILPLWTLRLDWSEFIREAALQRELRKWPSMAEKLRPFAQQLAEVEDAFAAGVTPRARSGAAAGLGFCAAVLRLNGRYKRSCALLNWLDDCFPGDALTHKRLADNSFTLGHRHTGWRRLETAMALAPENPMLRLSAAIRAADFGQKDHALRYLSEAQELWPGLDLVATVRRGFLGDSH